MDGTTSAERSAPIRSLIDADELALYEHVHRQMRAFCGPHPSLDDLVQTALEQILVAKVDARQGSGLSYVICYRVWLKHLRFTYRLRARIVLSLKGELPEIAQPAMSLEQLEQRERYQRLYQALDRLPLKRRAVVVMHDLSGLSIEEIAPIVGAKVATVRSRLRDGRRLLAVLLKSDSYFGSGGNDDE